jgi:hypothetical protein
MGLRQMGEEMKARDLLTIIERYAEASRMTTEKLLEEVPNDKFKLIVQSTATLFKHLKEEAIRRGIWDELRGMKP